MPLPTFTCIFFTLLTHQITHIPLLYTISHLLQESSSKTSSHQHATDLLGVSGTGELQSASSRYWGSGSSANLSWVGSGRLDVWLGVNGLGGLGVYRVSLACWLSVDWVSLGWLGVFWELGDWADGLWH